MALFDFLKRKKEKEEPARAGGHESVKKDITRMPASPKLPLRPRSEASQRGEPEKKVVRERAVSERMLADIIRPHVTERSRERSREGVYMFRVAERSTKHTIKQAIEALYRVAVKHVRVMRIHSKPRRRGLTRGTKKGYKKAAVTLRAGEHIELFS